jgi:hypothetical protein
MGSPATEERVETNYSEINVNIDGDINNTKMEYIRQFFRNFNGPAGGAAGAAGGAAGAAPVNAAMEIQVNTRTSNDESTETQSNQDPGESVDLQDGIDPESNEDPGEREDFHCRIDNVADAVMGMAFVKNLPK